jgi:hypothetical protein
VSGVNPVNPGYVSRRSTHPFHGLMPQQVDVPSVGKHGILGSWVTAFQWQHKARSLIQEGYEKVCPDNIDIKLSITPG